jgi:hypothetical protein
VPRRDEEQFVGVACPIRYFWERSVSTEMVSNIGISPVVWPTLTSAMQELTEHSKVSRPQRQKIDVGKIWRNTLFGNPPLTVVSMIDGRVIRIGQPGEACVSVHSETRRKVVETVPSEQNHQIVKSRRGNTHIINIMTQNGKNQRSQVEDLSFLRSKRGKRFPPNWRCNKAKYQDSRCGKHRNIDTVNWKEESQLMEGDERHQVWMSIVVVGLPGHLPAPTSHKWVSIFRDRNSLLNEAQIKWV